MGTRLSPAPLCGLRHSLHVMAALSGHGESCAGRINGLGQPGWLIFTKQKGYRSKFLGYLNSFLLGVNVVKHPLHQLPLSWLQSRTCMSAMQCMHLASFSLVPRHTHPPPSPFTRTAPLSHITAALSGRGESCAGRINGLGQTSNNKGAVVLKMDDNDVDDLNVSTSLAQYKVQG